MFLLSFFSEPHICRGRGLHQLDIFEKMVVEVVFRLTKRMLLTRTHGSVGFWNASPRLAIKTNKMEEVDRIILHSLRQIGCDIEEEVNSLKDFSAGETVKAAVSCLKHIQPGLDLPLCLPQNMAAKYRVGQMIAQACIDSGYPGEIGYQTFLYSGEADLRKVLMFLIEKLPKEQEKFVREPTGCELFWRQVNDKVKEELTCAWLPPQLLGGTTSKEFLSFTSSDLPFTTSWKEFCRNDIVFNSYNKKYTIPTVISLHSRGVLFGKDSQWSDLSITENHFDVEPTLMGKFSQNSLQRKQKPPVAPRPKFKLEAEEVKENKKLKEEEEVLTKELEKLVENIDQLNFKKNQLVQEVEKKESLLGKKREKDVVRAKVLELLAEGEGNVALLEGNMAAALQKLSSLAAQWERHRDPLITKYRHSAKLQSNRMNENVKKAETAKSLSEKRKELEIELKGKDQVISQLQSENEKNGKEVNRSAYTRRILEIINNIEKQKNEIEKVLKDTRDIQKEINNLSGQLDRSFTVADETIFRDAKKDETSRKAYKLLATLHSDCNQLIATAQETGTIIREIRDLEDQIEKEKSKNISGNLERITADLNQMKVESAQLSAQIKLKQGS